MGGGWSTIKLDDVARRGSGHTPSKRHPHYWGGPVKWVSLRDTFRLDRGKIHETASTITSAGLAHSSAVVHSAGSVILLRDAGIGKSAVLGQDMAVSQHFMVWSCGPKLDNWFLYYVLQSRKLEFERISNGSTIKTIGLDFFRQFEVPLPELDEQKRIAEALADVDHLISTLERQIAKEQAIKQGMMQQLLTGRTRLPGFSKDWRQVKLGTVAQMGSGGTPASSIAKYYGGGIPWVSISDMTRGGKFISRTETTLSAEGIATSAAKLYDPDVVLYAMYASIGECSLAVGRVSSSQAILGISVGPGLDREYLYYYLLFIRDRVKLLGQQGTQSNLNAGMVRGFDLPLPEIDEQRAIAEILGDVDSILIALKDKLAKARTIKTGMMQQLLTGRTRLPVEAA